MLVVGLMSGTSLDGITAALVEIEEAGEGFPERPKLRVKLLAHHTRPYPREVREELLALSTAGHVSELANMDLFLGELFAEAALAVVAKAGRDISEVGLIGSHGQTICHFPGGLADYPFRRPCTLQIGEIDVIAARTGVTTVGDFRPKDMAVGGQGAPLISYVDYQLFWHPALHRVLLNIGGIANVTYIPAGAPLEGIKAFDTGPGNMVIDGLVRRISNGQLHYDEGGAMAARGRVHPPLLQLLLDHPFITKEPPKTTGREEFGDEFVEEVMAQGRSMGLNDEDLVATVTAFTAEAIAVNCRRFLGPVDEVIVSGGGAYNRTLMERLAAQFPGIKVTTTQEYGIPVEAKEAVGFAVLAYQALHRRPNNAPSATGARRPVVMGKISWGEAR